LRFAWKSGFRTVSAVAMRRALLGSWHREASRK
jgi:hypothetical protein